MNIAIVAQDSKKELMIQFCIAYCGVLAKHKLCATATTGKMIADATGLRIDCLMPGSIGEISALALLIGGAYLLIRKVINWRIPVAFIGTVAILTVIFPRNGYSNVDWMLYNLLSGGLFLGAIFMATDYSSSPVTLNGQLLYGFGCGALTVLIRYFGGFPEGVSFAILIMNLCAWAIDKGTRGRQFGVTKEDLKAAKKAAKEAKA